MALIDYAIRYANKGFSVIPMLEKRPLIKFADKPPLTVEEVKELWSKYPYANLALKTDKFFVFDIDVHDNSANGIESFKTLPRAWFEDTLVQRTASGGYHYFFEKPKDRCIGQKIALLPGIDLKAHNNNYVLVAPSRTKKGVYEFLNKKPMKKAPDELLDFIDSKTNNNFKENVDFSNVSYNGKGNKTTELFEQIANGLGLNGGRNAMLASFCGGLLFRGVKPDIVLELARITNSRTEDPLSDKEVVTTVESMIKKEIRRRGGTVVE